MALQYFKKMTEVLMLPILTNLFPSYKTNSFIKKVKGTVHPKIKCMSYSSSGIYLHCFGASWSVSETPFVEMCASSLI